MLTGLELELGAGIAITNPEPVDARGHAPRQPGQRARGYASVADACAAIENDLRFDGMPVYITGLGLHRWKHPDYSDAGLKPETVTAARRGLPLLLANTTELAAQTSELVLGMSATVINNTDAATADFGVDAGQADYRLVKDSSSSLLAYTNAAPSTTTTVKVRWQLVEQTGEAFPPFQVREYEKGDSFRYTFTDVVPNITRLLEVKQDLQFDNEEQIPLPNRTLLEAGTDPNYKLLSPLTAESGVSSVNGLSGAVTVTKNMVGLGNVTNDAQVKRSELAAPLGVATLDGNGKLLAVQFPDGLLSGLSWKGDYSFATGQVTSPEAALNGQPLPAAGAGNIGWYFLSQGSGSIAGPGGTQISYEQGDWIVSYGAVGYRKVDNTDAVQSVAGKTGAVTLVKADVGLSNVDNTSDLAKPISTAAAAALAGKLDAATVVTAGTALKFDVERTYGSEAAPRSDASYSLDPAGAMVNTVVMVIHQAATAPTLSNTIFRSTTISASYKANVVNYLLFFYRNSSLVHYTIYQLK
ncbi:hypothetical protein [Hymenobacter guriensis]|uniref:Uncharacterized protein n=1 Tax=Hymenobacter guriensis TaxID=2793065 RepID=A0ABS0L0Y6_9BACT|nr:hypothetical protein [Hymenobacter guriensis]MBG8553079.1 hypothetical protein [Hymenobacter guriensis]